MTSLPTSHGQLPRVSVIVPLLDEVDAISLCVDSFGAQDYPLDLVEVLVVDGGSTDGSRERVEEMASTRPWLRLVANPRRRISAAFNEGWKAATGDVICLIGAHSRVGPDYVTRSVRLLTDSHAAGVGGRLNHEGSNPVSRAIGLAMISPFGMASPFRFSTEQRAVDTIGHPAYWRSDMEEIGPFDESLECNEDYEFNFRLRQAGKTLLFDPTIVTSYHPRGSLVDLGKQFFRYGRGKADVLRRHPGSLTARHLIAPAATAMALAVPLLAITRPGRRLAGMGMAAYAALLTAALVNSRPWSNRAQPVVFLAAFPVMHLSWGAGVLWTFAIASPGPGRVGSRRHSGSTSPD